MSKNQYNPDYECHPEDILKETLEERKLDVSTFAKEYELSEDLVHQLLNGEVHITLEIAIIFEKVLKTPARFWTNLEMLRREREK